MDEKIFNELIQIFHGEFTEQVQVMTDCLLTLEKDPSGVEAKDNIDKIFRAVHNIKGSAKGLELFDMGEIAHYLEDIFMALRDGRFLLTEQIGTLCFEAIDAMTHVMEACLNHSSRKDYANLVNRLKLTSEGQEVIENTKASNISDSKHADTNTKNDAAQIGSIRIALDKLVEVGVIGDELLGIKIKNNDITVQIKNIEHKINELNGLWENVLDAEKHHVSGKKDSDLQLLYKQLNDSNNDLKNSVGDTLYNIRSINAEFGLTLDGLNENARILRLMPLSTLLRPLLRTTRDLAKEMNKEVELEIIGEEVELDRSVLEQIKSPMVHLLRNAIDHGLEDKETRLANHKPVTGKIQITATEEGSEIHIAISDDGSGIGLNRITEKAIENNFISRDEADKLSAEAILDLLFLPGFSSKDIITDISGRGVGLDVVKNNIQAVKGRIAVESEEGIGTTFKLCFPLTLASDRGILIKVSGQLFVIPTHSVVRILNLNAMSTQSIEGALSVMLEDRPVPLFHMSKVMGMPEDSGDIKPDRLALVISKGRFLLGFIIDEILGEREIALKAILHPLTHSKYIMGATLNGRGEVILVLNPGDLIEEALASTASRFKEEVLVLNQSTPSILLAEDSLTTRTLEESILVNKGYKVTAVVNGSEAWKALQKDEYDIVVTDVEMPIMGGFELTEKIKKDKRLKDIPVIIVTSCSSDEDKKRGVKVGANAYITKGKFEGATLLKAIEQLIYN